MSCMDKKIMKKSYYLKTKKVKHDNEEYTYEEEIITEDEAFELRNLSSPEYSLNDIILDTEITTTVLNSCVVGPKKCIVGGEGKTIDFGDTYQASDNSDISVRKLTIVSVYNYTNEKMFVKATVQWYIIPIHRGFDLIGIGYTANNWYIETTNILDPSSGNYIQTANFSGKQIYEWEKFDYRYSDPIIGSETKSFRYSEANIEYYTADYTNGIVLKQNLKNNEIEFRPTTYALEAYGYRVTDLVLTLEAYIDNIGDNANGIFKASSLHQETYTTINIGDCSFTPTPPFISVPLGILQWGEKYEENGLNVSINVPID